MSMVKDRGGKDQPAALPVVRDCDGCTLCCKVLLVNALKKPADAWCPHCKLGAGCGIYQTRPDECRTFNCGYLVMPQLGPEWKPSVSHLIISSEYSHERLVVHVDKARPEAWRREPYYGWMRDWSRQALSEHRQVVIKVGQRAIMLLPDRDVDLGVLDANEQIVVGETRSGNGIVYEAYAVRVDSEVGRRIVSARGGTVRVGEGPEFRRARTLA